MRSAKEDPLTQDVTYRVLASPRRQTLLSVLTDNGERTVGELVRRIASRELDVPTDSVSSALRREVHISLVHVHLPLLAEYGVIEYDRSAETVVLREPLESTSAFLKQTVEFATDG